MYKWLDGADGWTQSVADVDEAAATLATFTNALHQIEPINGPQPGRHNGFRGIPLRERDQLVRSAIKELGVRVETNAVTAAWEHAIAQPHATKDAWIHADIHPGNILIQSGKITAVIDFGLLGVGDPACDLLPAWNLLTPQSRATYRSILNVDEPTWIRGQGWALCQALVALPYYWSTNPTMVGMAQRVIAEIMNECK